MNILQERFLYPLTHVEAFPKSAAGAMQAVRQSIPQVRDAWVAGTIEFDEAQGVSHALKAEGVRVAEQSNACHAVAMRVAFAAMAAGAIDGVLGFYGGTAAPQLVSEPPLHGGVSERMHTDGVKSVQTQVATGSDRTALARVYNDGSRLGRTRQLLAQQGASQIAGCGARSLEAAVLQLGELKEGATPDRFKAYLFIIAEESYQAGMYSAMADCHETHRRVPPNGESRWEKWQLPG